MTAQKLFKLYPDSFYSRVQDTRPPLTITYTTTTTGKTWAALRPDPLKLVSTLHIKEKVAD